MSDVDKGDGKRTAGDIAGDRPSDSRLAEFHQAVEAFGPALKRMAAAYEPLPHGQDDLLQEILFGLWKALPEFRRECSLKTLVFRIAQNRCLSHVARRNKAGTMLGDEAATPDPGPSPEDLAMDASRRRKLLRAIAGLPLGLKQVITLALEDLSPSEIADVLGITENNVYVRLNRAKGVLRGLMGEL